MKLVKLYLIFILLCHSFFAQAQTAGSFEPVPGSPFPAGTNPSRIAFSPFLPSGNLFAAATNGSSDTLSVYSVDPTTGVFTPIGAPVATGDGPFDIAFSPFILPNRLFAAVANNGSSDVSVYRVDINTGVFTPVALPVPAGGAPTGIAFSPLINGNSLYAAVSNFTSDNVSIYSVDLTTGVFTELIAFSPFPAGDGPFGIAFSPLVNGNLFATVANNNSGDVSVYEVNTSTGEFVLVETELAGSGARGPAFSPVVNGNLFAAVANFNANTLSVYTVDLDTGDFTLIPSSPISTTPRAVAFSPVVNGNLFAAVPNSGPNSVSVYNVDVDLTPGLFTLIEAESTGSFPIGIAFSPFLPNDNLFAAVTNNSSNNISVYRVNLAPTVGSINPSQGPEAGGTAVTITGTNLNGATSVLFGATPALSFIVNSNTQITAVSPPGTGTVDVTVTTPAGTSEPSPFAQFTYAAPPAPIVTSLNPSQGPTSGGTTVIITGKLFTGATSVLFGTTPALSFTVDSDTQITAVSPPGVGTVDVRVTTPDGTSAISVGDQFTYFSSIPIVTNISPSSGPTSGGTTVIITGSNFLGTTAVRFGTNPALSFVVNSDTQITAISPPGTGTVDVIVITPAGSSETSAADRFTYVGGLLPPKHLRGCQKIRFDGRQNSFVNILTWKAPKRGSSIVAYQIYRDRSLTRLIGVVPNEGRLKFRDPVRKLEKTYTYFVVSVDEFGNISEPVKVKIRGSCGEDCRH